MAQIIFFILVVISVGVVSANDNVLPKEEKMLRYQEVFHHFYRKDELNALVNLNAGFSSNMISPEIQSNQLLLGALYNSYGISSKGSSILKKVTTSASRSSVRDLAWFYLAKQYFADDSVGLMNAAMSKITKALPDAEQSEWQYLQGIFYLKQKEYKKAEKVLPTLKKFNDRYYFLLFNLGAALLKTNKPEDGVKYINQVGELEENDEVLLALKDKANVVLGYHYLRLGDADTSVGYFQRIRLQGAFSDKALLGLGWAYSQTSQHRRALAPWLLLAEQDSSHLEVQEVLMALPYTYRTLNSKKKAVELYQKSIAIYEKEKQKLDNAVGFVKSASLFSLLFSNDDYDDYAISRQLKSNLSTDLGKMLIELLEKKELQKMLDEFRDLLQLKNQLAHWTTSVEKMNRRVGSVETAQDLPKLSHAIQSKMISNAVLPERVARKIQYKEILITMGNRIRLQDERLSILLELYEQKIREAVLEELQVRDQYVLTYLSQTRYSLAELLDKSTRSVK